MNKNLIVGIGVAIALVGGYYLAKTLFGKEQKIRDLEAERSQKEKDAKAKEQLRLSYEKWSEDSKKSFQKDLGIAVARLKLI